MPPNLAALREQVRAGTWILSIHASDRAASRAIRSLEIADVLLTGTVIEDYPDDKYGPSCLILGYTAHRRPLHVQVSYPPQVKVITVYEPSPEEWGNDLQTRGAKK